MLWGASEAANHLSIIVCATALMTSLQKFPLCGKNEGLSYVIIALLNKPISHSRCYLIVIWQVTYKTNTTLLLYIIHNLWQHQPSLLLLSLASLIGFDSWAGSIGQALTGAEWQSVPDVPFWLSLPWEITSHSCPRILIQSTWLWSGMCRTWFLTCVYSLYEFLVCFCAHLSRCSSLTAAILT